MQSGSIKQDLVAIDSTEPYAAQCDGKSALQHLADVYVIVVALLLLHQGPPASKLHNSGQIGVHKVRLHVQTSCLEQQKQELMCAH